MSTKTHMPRNKRMCLLAFAPTLVCIGAVAFIASGASIVPGASAVTTAVAVDGTVNSTFTVDPGTTGGTGATGCADETLGNAFASAPVVSNGCRVTFTANSVNGVTITFDNNLAGANDGNGFFCADPAGAAPRDCGILGDQENRLEDVTGVNQALAADTFGLALVGVGGDGGTAAGAGAPTVDSTPNPGDASWNQIHAKNSGTALCATTGPNGGTGSTCDFVFGGQGSGASQGSGVYTGSLRLVTSEN